MRMTSKVWYVVAIGFIVSGMAVGVTGISQFISTVQDMQRVVMPGKAEIVLPAGTSTLYAESRSVIDGKAYGVAGSVSFRCAVIDRDGKGMPFEPSSSSVSYGIGDYAGRSAFDVRVETPGTYVLACEAPDQSQFAMAIGRGVGTWIVVGLVGGLVPIGLGVVGFILVLVRRRSQQRRAATGPAPVGGS